MFGLSTRERLIKAIKNVYRNESYIYANRAEQLFDILKNDNSYSKEQTDKYVTDTLYAYNESALNNLLNQMKEFAPSVYYRAQIALNSLQITGLPKEVDEWLEESGYSPGIAYAILIYAMKNKTVDNNKDMNNIALLDAWQAAFLKELLDETSRLYLIKNSNYNSNVND